MWDESMRDGWRAWSATAAFYNGRDPLSFLFAILGLLPIVVVILIAGVASATHTRQQASALVLLIGFLYNAALNAFLKILMRSPRPKHPLHSDSFQSSPIIQGMPSNHAQFMFFFTAWLMFRAAEGGNSLSVEMRGFLLLSALMVSYGRVYNEFHTPAQVVVGALVGMANAYLCTSTRVEALLQRTALAVIPLRDFCTAWIRFI